MTSTATEETAPAEALALGASRVYERMIAEDKWAAIAAPGAGPATLGLPQIVAWEKFDQFDAEQAARVDRLLNRSADREARYDTEEATRRAAWGIVPGAGLPAENLIPPVAEPEPENDPAPVLPPGQEAALERFEAAHAAEAKPDDDPDPDPDDDDLPPAAEATIPAEED